MRKPQLQSDTQLHQNRERTGVPGAAAALGVVDATGSWDSTWQTLAYVAIVETLLRVLVARQHPVALYLSTTETCNTFSSLATSDKLTAELNDNNSVRADCSEEPLTNASEMLLVEGEDYYLENGLYVFTSSFLLRRGYCCVSGCRNCPYPKESNE